MFCSKCGKEIHDEAVVCVHCGCTVDGKNSIASVSKNEPAPILATLALVFSFLSPIVGIILGIIGCTKYNNSTQKTKCIISIVVSIIVWIIAMAILGVFDY